MADVKKAGTWFRGAGWGYLVSESAVGYVRTRQRYCWLAIATTPRASTRVARGGTRCNGGRWACSVSLGKRYADAGNSTATGVLDIVVPSVPRVARGAGQRTLARGCERSHRWGCDRNACRVRGRVARSVVRGDGAVART